MRKLFFAFMVILSFCLPYYTYADLAPGLDWKKLHEKADTLTLQQALTSASEKPAFLANQYLLGLVYLNLHKDKEAGAVFSNMLGGNPELIEPLWGKAEVLRREHKLKEAQKICDKIIGADPGFSPAYTTLAFIKYLNMDFVSSLRLATKVIRQGRDNVDLSNYTRAYSLMAGARGMLAHYGGPFSKAIDGMQVMPNLRRAEELQPNSPGVLFGIGSYYFLAPDIIGGDLVKAQEYLEKTVKVDPLFADAYVRLAQVYKVKGDSRNYDLYLNKAFEIDPQNELALDIKNNKCKYICK